MSQQHDLIASRAQFLTGLGAAGSVPASLIAWTLLVGCAELKVDPSAFKRSGSIDAGTSGGASGTSQVDSGNMITSGTAGGPAQPADGGDAVVQICGNDVVEGSEMCEGALGACSTLGEKQDPTITSCSDCSLDITACCADLSFSTALMSDQGQSSVSLALDSLGRRHIAFALAPTVAGVGYAVQRGNGTWAEVVVGGEAGILTALALDKDDHPHIAYFAAAAARLRYAYFNGVAWTTVTPDLEVGGRDPAIAFGAQGEVHIIYAANGVLQHVEPMGTTFIKETIAEKDTFTRCALKIDAQGNLHAAWRFEGNLWYGTRKAAPGSPWTNSEVVAEPSVEGVQLSLAIGSNGKPRIAYTDDAGALHLATLAASGKWTVETPVPNAVAGTIALVMDSLDRSHIAYLTAGSDILMKATSVSGTWSTHEVAADAGEFISMVLDNEQRPHLAYSGETPSTVYTARLGCDL